MDWIRNYNGQLAKQDLLASLIVTVMLIPQSLAYAMLAGLPAQVGLYASILPLMAYAALGSSMTLAVGPVAVVSLMTAASVGAVATAGTDQYLAAAVLLALMSGAFLLLLGLVRGGFLANLLSHPVISGFISASAILIAASQLRHIFGIEGGGHTLIEILNSLAKNLPNWQGYTLGLGLACLAFLFWVRKGLKPLLVQLGIKNSLADILAKMGPMFAVIASTLWVAMAEWNSNGVAIVGDLPAGLPTPSMPELDLSLAKELWPAAVLISLVGFVESVSVGHTLAAKRRQKIQPNRELLGLGAANIASGLGGGFPVTGGFSRSVVNYDAGAQTPMAGVFTGVLIAVTALYFTGAFYFLPKVVLAATVIVAVISLADFGAVFNVFRYSKSDGMAMLLTIVVVLAGGVEAGILVGVVCSILCLLANIGQPHIAEIGRIEGTEHFRNVMRYDVECENCVASIRFDERLHFLNAHRLEESIGAIIERPGIQHVILHCGGINHIDASGLDALIEINHRLEQLGIKFHLSEVKGPVTDQLVKSELPQRLTGEIHLSHHQATCAIGKSATLAT